MRAQDLMSQPIITCHVNDPLSVAAQRMWDHDCGAIAVVRDDGKLAGMLTDRDVCMAAYTQGRCLDEILANSAMSRHAISAHAEARMVAIEKLMAEHQVRRIPIVDEEDRPIGILTLNDLARESVQPDTAIKGGASRLAYTLAAICRPRPHGRKAA